MRYEIIKGPGATLLAYYSLVIEKRGAAVFGNVERMKRDAAPAEMSYHRLKGPDVLTEESQNLEHLAAIKALSRNLAF